ncbi:MAG: hypothetical protein A2X82_20110 [Geobacteraceae bacterium GWC2_55_20]|nr:MAG: hypothetical protein A2X82_20110 [Geobacteraceae bacterium GWC2_55_20]OGU24438.1 MAG: hypothetical protein A2X85_09350 [Geobacteraceae bacterium GWF2_54_21]HCE68401.1 hypothetical protein [Geobacter sp.]
MRFVRRKEMLHMTGLTNTVQYQLEKEGKFPARRNITTGGSKNGGGLCAWLESDLLAWIESRPTVVVGSVQGVAKGSKCGRKRKIMEEMKVTGGEL